MFFRLSTITRDRLRRFRRIRRAWYSFVILMGLVILSLFSELWINSRALVVHYEGKTYFPLFHFCSARTFGKDDDSEANYRVLEKEFAQAGRGDWLLMPLFKYNPVENDFSGIGNAPYPPSVAHPLGTDDRGRDVLARLVYGFRLTIFFALLVAGVSNLIGVVLGAMLGYFGGRFDICFQRFIELWSTVPHLYLIIILASIFNPNFWLLAVIMILFDWMAMTYYFRTEAYREKAKDYVTAAQALGARKWRIIVHHVIPNSLVPLITYFPFAVAGVIFMLSGLDFLGYGFPPPTPSWGEMMKQAFEISNRDKFWLSLSPFSALVFTLTLVTFIGEGTREAFDPKAYTRYS